MNFIKFKEAVAKQFAMMSAHQLYVISLPGSYMWETYLAAFPEGTNPIYRVRTEHDCACCRQFIQRVGSQGLISANAKTANWIAEQANMPVVFADTDIPTEEAKKEMTGYTSNASEGMDSGLPSGTGKADGSSGDGSTGNSENAA